MNKGLLARATAALLAGLVLSGLALVFGPELAKSRLVAVAARALHRDVTVGHLTLLASWPPTVEATDVTVAGLGSAPQLRAELAPASLMTARPQVSRISLLRPTLLLAPDAQGRVALLLPRPAAQQPAQTAAAAVGDPQPARPAPRVVIQNGTLILRDPRIGPELRLSVSGTRQGDAYDFNVSGTIPPGTRLAWLAGAALTARVASGQPVHATLAGVLRGQSWQAALDTGPPEAMAIGRDLSFTMKATAPGAALHAAGVMSPGGGLAGSRPTVALHSFDLRAPQIEASGDLAVTVGPHPAIRGTLHAQRLDLDALLAGFAAPAPVMQTAGTAAPPAAPAPPPRAPWLIADRPLPLPPLGRADADLTWSAGRLRLGGVDYRDLAGHLALQAGRLTLAPIAVSLPGGGGRVHATLHLDAAASPPVAALSLDAPAVAVAAVLDAWHLPPAVSGTAGVEAALSTRGVSWHAMAAALTGTAQLHLADGAIDGRLLASLLGAARLPIRIGNGPTALRCAAVGFAARDGVLRLAPLVAEADRIRIEGAGEVDLGRETLAVQIVPLLRDGPGLVIPVQLGGAWRTPKVAVGLGSALPPDAACPAQAPTAPPGGKKHPKPIDLLRSLLR